MHNDFRFCKCLPVIIGMSIPWIHQHKTFAACNVHALLETLQLLQACPIYNLSSFFVILQVANHQNSSSLGLLVVTCMRTTK